MGLRADLERARQARDPGVRHRPVVIASEGFALTSAHAVGETDRGSASFVDGREVVFEFVWRDQLSDLAVLRLHVREARGSGRAPRRTARFRDREPDGIQRVGPPAWSATARPLWRAPVLLVAALQYAVVPHSRRWKGLRPLATSSG